MVENGAPKDRVPKKDRMPKKIQFFQACQDGNADRAVDILQNEIEEEPQNQWQRLVCNSRVVNAAADYPEICRALVRKFGWKVMYYVLNELVKQPDSDKLTWILQRSNEYFFDPCNYDKDIPKFYRFGRDSESSLGTDSIPPHPIWHAVRIGVDLSIIKVLVEKGNCIPLGRARYETSLLLQAREHAETNPGVVEYLENIASLLQAIHDGNHAEMERRLNAGAPADLPLRNENYCHWNALHLTFATGDVTAVQMLLDHGAQLHTSDLYLAVEECAHNRQDFWHWLCRHDVIDVNFVWLGYTPLEKAVKTQNHVLARVLLEQGATIRPVACHELYKCVLFQACDKNDLEMVRILLRHDNGVNLGLRQSNLGFSALHHAARKGYGSLVQAIGTHYQRIGNERALRNVLWGCNRTNDDTWRSPLQHAVDGGHLDIVQFLIVPLIVQVSSTNCHF